MILLNPGPVTLSAGVRAALTGPDLCHREPEFADLQDDIRTRLLQVYDLPAQDWASVLLTGSGTAAVEAMISSLVPSDGTLLIIENGVYGTRMRRIAEIHNMTHASHTLAWGERIDPAALAQTLDEVKPSHVAVVHHETTTGRLNELAGVAEVCKRHGVQLLLDGVSSFGAEAIDFEAWNITACAATANKCLHATPGAAFVITRRSALAQAQTRSLYLDLAAYCQAQDARGTPFTPSIQSFYALAAALAEFADAGGRQARHAQYAQLADIVARGLAALGIEAVLPSEESSVVLRSYRLPSGVSYAMLHDALKAHGYVIYAGQGELAKTIFRISTMGDIRVEDMHRLVASVEEISTQSNSVRDGL